MPLCRALYPKQPGSIGKAVRHQPHTPKTYTGMAQHAGAQSERFLAWKGKKTNQLAPVIGKCLKKKLIFFFFLDDLRSSPGNCAVMESLGVTQAPRTWCKYCTSRRRRVLPLLPLHIASLHPSPRVPPRCCRLALWANFPSPSHQDKDSVGVCSFPHPNCATCPAQPPCAGRLCMLFCKQTQPISSSPSDLSAERKAKLSLEVLLFILLSFPARRAGARGVQ